MKRRGWKSKGVKKTNRKRSLLLLFIIVIATSIYTFVYVEKHLKPPLMNIAKVRIKQISTEAINKAIAERIASTTNVDKLVDWQTDRNGKITGFLLNYAEHMRITAETVVVVQNTLNNLYRIPDYVPLGQAFDSVLIATYGPDVKIRFVPQGAVKIDLLTRQTDAGINNILVEVYMRVTTEVTIIIPFSTETEVLQTEVPISYILITGDVPMYYFDNKGQQMNPDGMGSVNVTPPPIAIPPMPGR